MSAFVFIHRGMRLKLKSLVLCVSLFASAAVLAQEAAPSPEHLARREATRKACDAEIKSTCAGKEGRETFQCLRASPAKLSAGCKDALSKLGAPAPAK
jgi:hypothetical protein